MPAIQPAKLKQQAAMLAGHYEDPAAFVRSLHYLLDAYADRARRPGQTGEPSVLLTAYRVRPPVLRQVIYELTPLVEEDPKQGLSLCDAMWQEPYLEFRQMAAVLLGTIPVQDPAPIFERVKKWVSVGAEQHLVETLLTQGLARVRREKPAELIRLIESWLSGESVSSQQFGLRTLRPLISEYENLPIFYRLIEPLLRSVVPAVRPDLLDVLASLAQRSSQETAYFLRQSYEMSGSADTAWLIRQSMGAFPTPAQEYLRQGLRKMVSVQSGKSAT